MSTIAIGVPIAQNPRSIAAATTACRDAFNLRIDTEMCELPRDPSSKQKC
jgi:hypothetical protein